MVTKNKLGTGNKRLMERDWTDMGVKKSNEMIDKVLKRIEQLRRLEEYAGERHKTVNSHAFTIPEPYDDDYKRIRYKKMQELRRKAVERAFGVLKKKWVILAYPA
nr:hypothetical protein [Tanacetum cinerariifolium]